MTRMLCSLLVLMTIGCSSSPTAPTPSTPPPTQAGPPVIQLQWVAAASCAPVSLPPSQPPFSAATIAQQADGSIRAWWPYQSGGRSATLHATFVNENGSWALCSWDIADI